ncbi:MAG TPA: carboxymuconolactone decarboxylase family protein [Blastocatellia bacterium]|nr:carboxymuconolactone decarboxylase family protein [Blastocatellia bacterium]
MAWIRIIEEHEADNLLQREYDAARRRAGKVFNIVKVQSLNPAALRAGMQLYLTLMYGPSELSRAERELLAVVTSWANNCFY